MEFPDFVIIDRIYRSRQFEFISINADKLSRKDNVLKFLQKNEASNKNYIFNSDNNDELVEAVDPQWTGALPYTILVEQGGKILYRNQGPINVVEMRKLPQPSAGRLFTRCPLNGIGKHGCELFGFKQ